MKNFILLFLSSMIFLISCLKEASEIKVDYVPNSDYFPLHVGNEWDYISGLSVRTDTMEIVDGQEYYRFVSRFYNLIDTVHYRKDSKKIFEKVSGRPEFLRFDLEAIENKTWTFNEFLNSPYEYIATVRSKEAIVEAENFEFKDCYHYYYDIPELADDEHEFFLAKGVGLVHQIYWGGFAMEPGLNRMVIQGVVTNY